MSFLRKNLMVRAVLAAALGLGFVGCVDDEPVKLKEVIEAIPEVAAPKDAFMMPTIYFEFDKSAIKAEHQRNLEAFAEHLRGNNKVVQLEGHCDERGTIEYNLALGERRAQAVKNYLMQLGVDGARITTISFGEEKPAEDEHNEFAWAKNRRVENTTAGN